MQFPWRKQVTVLLLISLGLSYVALLEAQGWWEVRVGTSVLVLPLPDLRADMHLVTPSGSGKQKLLAAVDDVWELERTELIKKRRKEQIAKVERFFDAYTGGTSKLRGYESILVDQSEKCGGDYRVLVGIAGSESGLGRIMYKRYNPFGYIDGVQYPDLKTALTTLSCKISTQHIARCGTDLNCLARRYGGSDTNLPHFISKVRWFAQQVS